MDIPGDAAFQPANQVEAAMLEAVRQGDADAYLKALIVAELVVPAGTDDEPEPPRIRVSGDPAIPLFTSPERLAERYAGQPYDLVTAVTVVRDWPDREVALTLNPGTAIGAHIPGPQVAELAAWAVEIGLVDILAEDPPGRVSRRTRRGSPGTPGAPRGAGPAGTGPAPAGGASSPRGR